MPFWLQQRVASDQIWSINLSYWKMLHPSATSLSLFVVMSTRIGSTDGRQPCNKSAELFCNFTVQSPENQTHRVLIFSPKAGSTAISMNSYPLPNNKTYRNFSYNGTAARLICQEYDALLLQVTAYWMLDPFRMLFDFHYGSIAAVLLGLTVTVREACL